jgi:hypothetical protein
MLRHACGYALANKGHDTRAIQWWLGHRSITSTAVYTALAPNRFKDFWRDYSAGVKHMAAPSSSQGMLLARGKAERKVVAIDAGGRKPGYGEILNVPVDGRQLRANVLGVWQPPWLAPARTYMINADEIE